MGLFERTKHLERLAKEIADQNLRQLGSTEKPDKEQSRRQILELEAVLREYRLHLDEAEARREAAAMRELDARAEASRWLENAALARDRKREDLAQQAGQRAAVYERERDTAKAEADHHASTIHRLRSEIGDVEKRIAQLRALRKGSAATLPALSPATRRTTNTTRLAAPPRDPLEEAFDELKEEEED